MSNIKVNTPQHTVVMLTEEGLHRVLGGQQGMTFIVDKFTPSLSGGLVAHVRDYRYRGFLGRDFQIWSISPGGYEIINQ